MGLYSTSQKMFWSCNTFLYSKMFQITFKMLITFKLWHFFFLQLLKINWSYLFLSLNPKENAVLSGFHWMLIHSNIPYSLPLTVQSAIMSCFLKWRIWCYNQNSSKNITLPILIPPPSICEKEWFQVLWLLAWPLHVCTKMWYSFLYELECKMAVKTMQMQ